MSNEGKQYLKYKELFKQYGILDLLAKGFMLISVVFFLFIPCFKIVVSDEILGREIEFEWGTIKFSIFDEISLILKNLFKGDAIQSEGEGMGTFFSIFQLFILILIAIAAVILIKDLIKQAMNFVNLENYALEEYDKIKTRGQNSVKALRKMNAELMFYLCIAYEVFVVLIMKLFARIPDAEVAESGLSYMMFVNGVSGGFWAVVVFLVISVALSVWKSRMKQNIKMRILREDYNLEKNEQECEEEKTN